MALKRFWYLRWLAVLAGVGAIFAIAAVAAAAVYVARLSEDLPEHSVLAEYQPPITTRVHAGDGSLIGEFARENRLFVPIGEIPAIVRNAFLAAEDASFYQHGGIDFKGILRANIANVSNYLNNRRLEGGSTITQQVAKNFLLSSDVKIERKVKEMLIARRIESAFTKDQILELYLNEIYLGMSAYGVASAALQYFDKPLDELTIAEAAYLAAVPKAPNNYHPIRNRERAITRRNYVIGRLEVGGYISHAESLEAEAEDLVVFPRKLGNKVASAEYFVEEVRKEIYSVFGQDMLYEGGLSVRTSIDTGYQRVAQRVLRGGLLRYDKTQGYRGPVSTIDVEAVKWQDAIAEVKPISDLKEWTLAVVLSATDARAEIGLRDGGRGHIPLEDLAWARRRTNAGLGPSITSARSVLKRGDVVYAVPVLKEGERQISQDKSFQPDQITHWSLQQVPQVNGALVAMDPHTGRVLAIAGGFSFALSEFNRAVQAKRQPGSSFKPFVYAAAMDVDGGRRFTPSSLVLDAPFVLDQGAGLGFWKPDNYDEDFAFAPSTLRRGIERSRNVMTVRLAQEVGMDLITDYAYRFGIIDEIPNFKPLSMAIGAMETTLLRMTNAYSILVNGGKKVTPTLIDRVQDRFGKTIYRHDERMCSSCNAIKWDGEGAPVLPDTREQTIDPRTAFQMVSILEGVVLRGTGRSVKAVGKPLGGKTGTTNEERDAWFVGFSPDLAVGVFVGHDTPRPMGRRGTGGGVAAPIFRDFMQAVIGDKPGIPFRTPPGIRLVRVRLEDGQPARPGESFIVEAFKIGTEPTGESSNVIQGQPMTMGEIQPNNSISGRPSAGNSNIESGTGGLY